MRSQRRTATHLASEDPAEDLSREEAEDDTELVKRSDLAGTRGELGR